MWADSDALIQQMTTESNEATNRVAFQAFVSNTAVDWFFTSGDVEQIFAKDVEIGEDRNNGVSPSAYTCMTEHLGYCGPSCFYALLNSTS